MTGETGKVTFGDQGYSGGHSTPAPRRGFPVQGFSVSPRQNGQPPVRPPQVAEDRSRTSPVEILGSVPRIVDGDTLEVAGQKVRLQGIDAPESAQSCRQASGHRYPCGDHATQALRTRIGPDAVTCTIEGRDRYLRALGMCSAADGTDLNGWLVSQGHALAYRKYSTTYVPEEGQAKAAQAGIWAGEFRAALGLAAGGTAGLR